MGNPKVELRSDRGSLYLAIDQGGQSSRAIVFDQAGQARASASVAVSTSRPGLDRVEQNPTELLESVTASLAAIAEDLGVRTADIRAVGLATQRSSLVCWDRKTGEPLSQVISWQDRRGEALVRRLRSRADRVSEITGLVLSSHYGASKIRWCLDHLPAVRKALSEERLACGPLASYLLFQLCEQRPFVVDPAIAARTLLFDLGTLDWSPELLGLFGVPRSVLPTCVRSRHEFGSIRIPGATLPMTVSTGDQSAALFADGMQSSTTAFVNLGTGAFIQRRSATRRASSSSRLLRGIVWRDEETEAYALEGSINGCGSALAKVGAELGYDSDAILELSPEWFEKSEDPPLYLNGVSGLGSPYWIADYPTRLVGSGEPWQVMMAVFESILFLLQVNLEEMSRELGAPERIRITGGLAASDGLCRRLADVSGLEVVRAEAWEATGRGLAWLMTGDPSSDWAERIEKRFSPQPNPRLRSRFRRWRRELEIRLPSA